MGSHLVSALVGEPVTDWVQLLIATATALLGALGLAYWAYRAQSDRSALRWALSSLRHPRGAAAPRGRRRPDPGRSRSRPDTVADRARARASSAAPFREPLARVTPLDPDSAIDMTGLSIVLGLLGLFVGNSLAPMAERQPPELIPSVGIVELLLQAAFSSPSPISRSASRTGAICARPRSGSASSRPDLRTIGIAVAAPSPPSSWRASPVSSRSSSIPD